MRRIYIGWLSLACFIISQVDNVLYLMGSKDSLFAQKVPDIDLPVSEFKKVKVKESLKIISKIISKQFKQLTICVTLRTTYASN